MPSERKDRKHVCDCPDKVAGKCPRHGEVKSEPMTDEQIAKIRERLLDMKEKWTPTKHGLAPVFMGKPNNEAIAAMALRDTHTLFADIAALLEEVERLRSRCDTLAREGDKATELCRELAAALRATGSEAIKTGADLVRLGTPDRLPKKWGELVRREAVVDLVMRMKNAVSTISNAALARYRENMRENPDA